MPCTRAAHKQWLGNPKITSSARVITLPLLITLLRDYLKRHDNEFMFTADGGNWLWRSTFTQRILKPAVNGNEDGPRNRARTVAIRPGLTFHGLRHRRRYLALIFEGLTPAAAKPLPAPVAPLKDSRTGNWSL